MHQLISLFFGVWAILPEQALLYLPQVKRLLDGEAKPLTPEQLASFRAAHQPSFVSSSGIPLSASEAAEFRLGDGSDVTEDDPGKQRFVMVMPLRGAIHRYDVECGPYGTETRAKWLRMAERDSRIVGVVIDADSPGGEGGGMRVLVDQIESMKKPVVTYVNHGLAASAMYGIAAATREILISSTSDVLGSIGTYMEIPDIIAHYRDYFKLPVHRVFASASTEKNRPWLEALKADPNDPSDKHYELLRNEIIDPFNSQFIAGVKRMRPAVKDAEGVFNGKVFFGDDAIRLGLADAYGTLDIAIDRVHALSKQDRKKGAGAAQNAHMTQQNTPPQTMSLKSKLVAVAAALGLSKEEADQETINAANAELAERGVTNVALVSTAEQTRLKDHAAAVQAAEQRATEADARATQAATALQSAEADAATARGEAQTANERATGIETAIAAAITTHKVTKADGQSDVDAVLAHVAALSTQLTEAQGRIATLEAEPDSDGKGAGATNGKGDLGETELSEDEKAFADQAKKDMAKLD